VAAQFFAGAALTAQFFASAALAAQFFANAALAAQFFASAALAAQSNLSRQTSLRTPFHLVWFDEIRLPTNGQTFYRIKSSLLLQSALNRQVSSRQALVTQQFRS